MSARSRFACRLPYFCLGLALALVGCSDDVAPPEAVIQAPATVDTGDLVQLDGSGSTATGGGTLSYVWRISSRPAMSEATLNDTTIVNPSFVADQPGHYGIELVVSDGTHLSAAQTVIVTASECGARPPEVAQVRSAPAAPTAGQTVRLEADVADPDSAAGCGRDQPLAYRWSLTGLPTGSRATLNDPTLPSPWFEADASGTYVVELVVTDSAGFASRPSSLTLEVATCGEAAPTVTAASAIPTTPAVGQTTELTASAEDADNGEGCDADQTLGFAWSLVAAPAGSQARLQRADRAQAWLVPDRAGEYELAVVATDSTGRSSAPTGLTVTASDADVVATVAAEPAEGLVPLAVDFSCSATGDAPLRYAWTFGDGSVSSLQNPSFTYVTPGLYTATCLAEDADGDWATGTVDVSARADTAPRVELSASTRAGVAPLAVTFTAVATGGEGDLTYAWAFGDGKFSEEVAPSNTFADPGLYGVTLTVTDGDGDVGSALIEIAVGSDALPAVAAAAQPAEGIAPLEVQLSAATAGGNPPLTFDWSFGDGDGSTLQNPRHTYAAGGDVVYTAEVTVTDADGDTATSEVLVQVAADAAVAGTEAQVSATGGRVPLLVAFDCNVDEGNAPIEYSWTFGDGATANLKAPSHIYREAGSYTATCLATDADGDVQSDSVTITVELDRVPVVALSASATSGVEPLSVSLLATAAGGDGPLTYRWDFGDGTVLPNGSATQNRTYTAGTWAVGVIVEDADGDTDRAQIVLSVDPEGAPLEAVALAEPRRGIASASEPLPVAFSARVSGGNAPYAYAWSFDGAGASTLENPTVSLVPGTYDVTLVVTDADGDAAAAAPVQIVVDADLSPATGPLTATDGDPLDLAPLRVDFTCPVSGGNPPLATAWSFGDGQGSALPNPSHTYAVAGSYTATCAVTDADGDQSSASIDVSVVADTAPVPAILGGVRTGLAPLTVDVASSLVGGNGAVAYVWDFGAAGIDPSTAADPGPVTYAAPGTYTIVLRVTDGDGDVAETTATVVVGADDAPVVAIAADRSAGVAPLTVAFSAAVAGGNGTPTLSWDLDGDGTFGDSLAPNPSFTYGPGAVTVSVRATDEDGSSDTDSLQISAEADLVMGPVTAGHGVQDVLRRAPLAVDLTCAATGGNEPLAYRWSFGDGATSTIQNATHVYAAAGTYNAVCTAVDADGDENSATTAVLVNADTPPAVVASAAPTSGLLGPNGREVSFAAAVSGGNGAITYAWDFDEDDTGDVDSTEPAPRFTYNGAGTYHATVTVTDGASRTASDTIDIEILPYPVPRVVASAVPGSGVAPVAVRFFANTVGGEAPLTFEWNFGEDGPGDLDVDSNERNPTFVYEAAGSYTAHVRVTDALGGFATATTQIEVAADEAPVVSLAAPVLDRTRAPVTATLSCSFDGGNGPHHLEWTFGDGQTATVNNATSPQGAAHTYGVAGSYGVQCVVTDADGDTATAQATVAVGGNSTPAVTVAVDAAHGVAPHAALLTASALAGDGEITWSWDFGGGTGTDLPVTSASEPAVFGAGAHLVRATACDADGDCGSATTVVTVEADTAPGVTVAASPSLGETPLAVALSAHVTGGNMPVAVSWDFGDGTSGTGTNVAHTFVAPDGASFTATATVTDADGDTASESVQIAVAPGNRPPVANAGEQTCFGNRDVQLDGRASFDPDGLPLTYAWSLASRPSGSGAELSGATVANPVLRADVDGVYEVVLDVSDGVHTSRDGLVLTLDTNMTLTRVGADERVGDTNDPIVPAFEMAAVNGCGAPVVGVCVEWREEDPQNGAQVSFASSVSQTGPDGRAVLAATFGPDPGNDWVQVCTPAFCGQGPGQTLTDAIGPGIGLQTCESVFDVTAFFTPPLADAGPDQTVDRTAQVQLDGTASADPFGEPLTYSWTQLAGTPVALGNPDTATPTFVTPDSAPHFFTFELEVCDPKPLCDTDTVEIALPNNPPVVDAGPDRRAGYNEVVTLAGTAEDLDGDDITFAWTQVHGREVDLVDTDTLTPSFLTPDGRRSAVEFQLEVCDHQDCTQDQIVIITPFFNNIINGDFDLGEESWEHEGGGFIAAGNEWHGPVLSYASSGPFNPPKRWYQAVPVPNLDAPLRVRADVKLESGTMFLSVRAGDAPPYDQILLGVHAFQNGTFSSSSILQGTTTQPAGVWGSFTSEDLRPLIDSLAPDATFIRVDLYTEGSSFSSSGSGYFDNVALTVGPEVLPTANAFVDVEVGGPLDVAFAAEADWELDDVSVVWDFGDNSTTAGFGFDETYTYANLGSYNASVVVEDGNGATATSMVSFQLSVPPPTAQLAASPLVGRAPLVVQLTASCSTGSCTHFSWTFPNGTTSTQPETFHTFQTPGTYLVSLAASDDFGQSDSESVVVVVEDPEGVRLPNGDFEAGLTGWISEGSTPSVTADNPAHGQVASYASSGPFNPPRRLFQALRVPAGNAPLRLRVDVKMTGGTVYAELRAGNNPPYGEILLGTHAFQAGAFVPIQTLQGIHSQPNNVWGSYTSEDLRPVIDALAPDATFLRVDLYTTGSFFSASGTAYFDNVALIEGFEPPPAVTADADPLAGGALDVLLSAEVDPADADLIWDFGDGTSAEGGNEQNRTYGSLGTWTASVVAQDVNGATSTDMVTFLLEAPVPVASFTANPLWGPAPLDVQFDGVCTTGDCTVYEWSFGDGGSASVRTPGHTYLLPGTYRVTFTARDDFNQSDSETVLIVVTDPNGDWITNGAFESDLQGWTLEGSPSLITDNDVHDRVLVFGSTDGPFNPPGRVIQVMPVPEGGETLRLRLDAKMLSGTAFLDVRAGSVPPYDQVLLGTHTISAGDFAPSPVLQDTTVLSHGSWGSFTSEDLRPLLASSAPDAMFLRIDVYTTGSFFSGSGTARFDNIRLITGADVLPEIDVEVDTTVGGVLDVDLWALTSAEGDVMVTWDFGDGTTGFGLDQSITYGGLGSYTVSAVVEDASGATSCDMVSFNLEAPFPQAAIDADPLSGSIPLTVNFSGSCITGDCTSYSWTFGPGEGTSTEQNPVYVYETPGTYEVTLTVGDDFGQIDTDSTLIVVLE